MASPQPTQIDLRLSADAVGVRNDPHQGPRSKAKKVAHFGCKSGLKTIWLYMNIKLGEQLSSETFSVLIIF